MLEIWWWRIHTSGWFIWKCIAASNWIMMYSLYFGKTHFKKKLFVLIFPLMKNWKFPQYFYYQLQLIALSKTVIPERGSWRPPPRSNVGAHTIKHAVSVCLHFLASISRFRLLSQDRKLCFWRLRVKVTRSRRQT